MGSKGANKEFDYNLIKVLDAVISSGNAAKAAKKLSVTPAAISLALTRLQGFYPDELFIRGKDGLIPTAKAVEIHHSFRQVMALINNTFIEEQPHRHGTEISVLGGEIVESYYLSQLNHDDVFARFAISHFSGRNMPLTEMKELLLTGECDLVIGMEPLVDAAVEFQLIDTFKHYVCICSEQNLLAELSQLSLHHFYSAHHAVYQSGIFSSTVFSERSLLGDDALYKGTRIQGYRGDSISGIISIVERTSLIATLPLKLALFFKNQRRYTIKMVQPPPELTLRPLSIYASWNRNSHKRKETDELVTMLHALSSFRR
ncbi:LysR family transcriptional regulator [Pseudocitrobacter cyperus]|uniref:LysR family transcriptional regulator n=1 Tax=Pseudocitrobacter cyperus TaxID=3112843 RepID=A0ABV0HI45_9ENTR